MKRDVALCFHTHAASSTAPLVRKSLGVNRLCSSDEPLLLALLDGLGEGRVADDDGRVRAIGRVRALGLVGVVGAFVAEQVAHHKHHDAEDREDHHGDDAWRQRSIRDVWHQIHFAVP